MVGRSASRPSFHVMYLAVACLVGMRVTTSLSAMQMPCQSGLVFRQSMSESPSRAAAQCPLAWSCAARAAAALSLGVLGQHGCQTPGEGPGG